MTISMSIETITPDSAKAILENNIENRALKDAIVQQYAMDMANGHWKLTGQGIVIADNGMLNDGQHRLHAVVRSGASVEMVVIRGAARDTRGAVDIGQNRTTGDVATMFHVSNGNAVCALARNVISWEMTGKLGKACRISKTTIIERAKTDERLQISHQLAKKLNHIASQNPIALARYIIPDGNRSDIFFERLIDGQELPINHPVLTLRNFFLRNGRKMTVATAAEATLRGWAAFVQHRELGRIQIMGDFPPITVFQYVALSHAA